MAGSDGERQAANRLADSLRKRGRAVAVESVSVRISEAGTTSIHSLIAVLGGLVGVRSPLIGAAIVLISAFSFYAERSFGLALIGRLVPKRASQNVISPPPGPAWEDEVEVVLTAGYDLPAAYPFGEWLSRRFSGRLTTDRLLLWGGTLPIFVATMMRAAGIEDFGVGAIQLVGSAISLSLVAAQIDRGLTREADPDPADLAASRDLLTALDELLDESDGDPPVAVCFFGAESRSGAGAGEFLRGSAAALRDRETVFVNYLKGGADRQPDRKRLTVSKDPVLVTAREGDLAPVKMNAELGDESPLKPEPANLRAVTAATQARRRGLRATTVIGSGEGAVDVSLDLIDNTEPRGDR